ncbi:MULTISPECIES: site-specific tyrosine recombinase/integron integrase [unclassified Thermoplasma]|uniref:site-specific tyrosine recombinase/integron integrase n=1 Tax=unclassified Thermoplasma TaxID=2684908 RepID=UPI000DA0FABE|nr:MULTISPECIES: site-specific tyrosine recombinase/integron integrase [unclassified Thermoplasma]PYB67762.1 integrase [Thermoplasma sp. Kam2015]
MPAESGEYLAKFVEYMTGERKSRYTIKEYRFLVGQFLEFMRKDPSEVTPMDIERYKNYLAVKLKYSKTSQYLAIKAVKLFYKSLDLKIPVNLTPPKRPMHIPVYLTEDEAKRLIDESKADRRMHAIVSVLAYTGIRVGELCNLRISDVDLQEAVINVRSGKGDKDRIVIMSEECVKALSEYLDERLSMESADDYLFISNKHVKYDTSTIERMIRRLGKQAGIQKNVTPHVLRHTFATSVLRNGGDIRFIQQILGHASVATTQIYTHLNDSALREMYTRHRPRY